MLQSWKSGCWKLGLGISLALGGAIIAASGNCALAQVVPDSTLGNESSVVTPLAPESTVDEISRGARRGANLFHSFEQFSVLTGRTAYFNNALDIQNIISRVTGGSVSNINGLIRANGSANLFLINPNGILFGPNATLNIGGSFLASTANSMRFEDGTGFSATDPETRPLLTVTAPIGLQFGGGEGRILNQSVAPGNFGGIPTRVGLQVQTGNTLALVGGDVELEGGNLTAEAGRIELGSVAGSSLVRLEPTTQGWTLGYNGVENFRNIRLSQQAFVNATGNVGGNIKVQGRRVTLTEGSLIAAFTVSGPGGTLEVNASDSVELTGSTGPINNPFFSSLRTDTVGAGQAGDLRINTGNLLVRDGAFISAYTSGTGPGGNLYVTASGSVEVVDRARLTVETFFEGTGNAGNLDITARSIRLDNQSAISAKSLSGGNNGNITLRVQDLLLLRGGSQIFTTAGSGGNGGNIITEGGTPFIVAVPSENSDIRASASGSGGSARITAQGIFGTQFQKAPTPESDITATGEFELNTPNVFDPSRGLVTLPAELVDVSGLIVQGCPGGGGAVGAGGSEFTVTGRGGLPPNPREALGSEPALADLGTPVQSQENRTSAATSINSTSSEAAPLVEAQGWVIGSNGEVVLTAQAPSVTPHNPWLTPNKCHGS